MTYMVKQITAPSLLSLCGITTALLYGYLAVASHQNSAGLAELAWVCGIAAILCFSCWAYYHNKPEYLSLHSILFWAIVFRLIGVLGFPLLEDDFYRYLWDGRMLVEYGSPYGIAPSMFFEDSTLSEQFDTILSNINHPNIATIYGPLCQWIFALGYWLAPGEVWVLQAIFAAFDIALILLLSRMTKPVNVLLYAWCPLIIKEFAFTAHTDVMAVCLLIFACYFWQRQALLRTALLLALAVSAKLFALVMVPFLLRWQWRAWMVFFALLASLYLPFASDLFSSEHGLIAMSSGWVFNSLPYYLARVYQWHSIQYYMMAVLLAVYGYGFFRGTFTPRDSNGSVKLPRGDWIFAALLATSPVINPWYGVWVLAFAAAYPSLWAWTASIALLLSYVIGLYFDHPELLAYEQPPSILLLEYTLIIAAIGVGYWYKQYNSTR